MVSAACSVPSSTLADAWFFVRSKAATISCCRFVAIIKVQVKSTEGSTGDPVVSALYGKVGAAEYGLLVTLGTFTTQAANFARSKSNLRLIDGDDLVNLILQHYEQFDSRYKGLLPLKRVFVPEVLEEAEE